MKKLLTNNLNKKLMKQYNLNLNSWNSFLFFLTMQSYGKNPTKTNIYAFSS